VCIDDLERLRADRSRRTEKGDLLHEASLEGRAVSFPGRAPRQARRTRPVEHGPLRTGR
jgi:hypothetical protein